MILFDRGFAIKIMARRNVLTTKNDEAFLRQISKPVEVFDEKLHQLLDDMTETMHAENGLGLAAPQVGVLKRVFLVGDGEVDGEVIEFINPEIIKQSGQNIESEGCLSIPGQSATVARPKRLTVRFQDRHGEFFTFKTQDALTCAAICHELDHLNGILYIDKIVVKEQK
ncbi:MAG: peptide deformylase [Firmicutes bacterium]|nr:peptide deformylase [Bacillota bacterium]